MPCSLHRPGPACNHSGRARLQPSPAGPCTPTCEPSPFAGPFAVHRLCADVLLRAPLLGSGAPRRHAWGLGHDLARVLAPGVRLPQHCAPIPCAFPRGPLRGRRTRRLAGRGGAGADPVRRVPPADLVDRTRLAFADQRVHRLVRAAARPGCTGDRPGGGVVPGPGIVLGLLGDLLARGGTRCRGLAAGPSLHSPS